MSDTPTPRTDMETHIAEGDFVTGDFARQLERELAAANERIGNLIAAFTADSCDALEKLEAAHERIRRLEESLEFGVGLARARELLAENHIGDFTEMVEETKEVPCPDCYGGHFKPCNICGDSGVALLRTKAKESTP